MKNNDFITTAIEAAQQAGKIIVSHFGTLTSKEISHKMPADFVTIVDKESEELIIKTIKEKYPYHLILAEETVHHEQTGEYRWIIDPLDGTNNYVHSFPHFSVSIALEYKNEIIAGVVFDPIRDELFTAEQNSGAFLNGRRISVSKCSLSDALIETGFPFRNREFIEPYLKLFKSIFDSVGDVRRAGSAALDLAYVASGRCEGFFELGLSPWDTAAGALMVKEAGGIITDFFGTNDYLNNGHVIAGTPTAYTFMVEEVQKVFNLTMSLSK